MTTPSYPSRRFMAAGARLGSAWGTAVALGAGYGVLIENDGNPQLKQSYNAHEDIGNAMPLDGDLGPIGAIDFSPDFFERYDPGPLGSMIAGLFGTCPVPEGVYVVSTANNKIDFDEAGETPPELTGTVASGTYTGTELAVAIAVAMNAAVGKALTYTCTYAAATNKFTIGAGANFNIRWNTGTHKAADISTLCGYSDAADDTGDDSYVSDTAGLGTAMKHVMDWADYADYFFTFAAERPGTIVEVPSAVPMKYGIKVTGGYLKGSIGLRGDTVKHDSAINTATEMDAVTYQDRGHRIKLGDGVLRINAQSGDALAVGDVLEISDLDFSYERSKDEVHGAGSDSIILPREKDFKMTVKVTLPRTSAANLAYMATFQAMTAQKMDIIFTSKALAAAGVYYSKAYKFPRLKLSGPPAAALNDVMSTVLTFEAEEAASAPTGMTGHVRPYIESINLQSTGYLA